MNKTNKMMYLAISIVILFAVSFILLVNDQINFLIVSSTITVILIACLLRLIFKKEENISDYERQIKTILKNYDSMLVYCDENYEFNNEQIIFVKRLEDLIKSSEELNIPIAYIREEHSSVFLLKEEKEILVYVMKEENDSSDFEKILIDYQEEQKKNDNSQDRILDNIDNTMLIKLKNNKVYKVSPIKKSK